MERGDWQVTVHGVTKSQTQLSDTHTHTHTHMSIESMMPSNHLIPFSALSPSQYQGLSQ